MEVLLDALFKLVFKLLAQLGWTSLALILGFCVLICLACWTGRELARRKSARHRK